MYPAVWQSRDGVDLDLDPVLLPGGMEHGEPNGLTVIGEALIAQGRHYSGDTKPGEPSTVSTGGNWDRTSRCSTRGR